MTTQPLPPIAPDPLDGLRASREAMLPAMRALFENPNNAAAKAQLQALLPAEKAERAKVEHLLRPGRPGGRRIRP